MCLSSWSGFGLALGFAAPPNYQPLFTHILLGLLIHLGMNEVTHHGRKVNLHFFPPRNVPMLMKIPKVYPSRDYPFSILKIASLADATVSGDEHEPAFILLL